MGIKYAHHEKRQTSLEFAAQIILDEAKPRMRLTQWTDYTLRVLMYCAASQKRNHPVTITEIAEHYDISRSHLTKIVQQLGASGLLNTTRGRSGGIRFVKQPSDINLGALVRATETDFHLVECFDPATNQCRLSPHCGLQGILAASMNAFLQVLDRYTLADLMVSSDLFPPDFLQKKVVRLVPDFAKVQPQQPLAKPTRPAAD